MGRCESGYSKRRMRQTGPLREAAAGSAISRLEEVGTPRSPTMRKGQDYALDVLPDSRRIAKDTRTEFATHRYKTMQMNIAAHPDSSESRDLTV